MTFDPDRMAHEHDPSDRVETDPPEAFRTDDDREIAGYYDADDGFAHLDDWRGYENRGPF